MNNLTTFADFAKGVSEPKSVLPDGKARIEEDSLSVDTTPSTEKALERKFMAHHVKYFGKKQPHEELKQNDVNMKPFKNAYEKVEKEYTSLFRELNRIESGDSNLKKDTMELKKCFSDLLVKLQFFTEYKQPLPEDEKKPKEKGKSA